jgi:hypothetical protein
MGNFADRLTAAWERLRAGEAAQRRLRRSCCECGREIRPGGPSVQFSDGARLCESCAAAGEARQGT